MSDQNEECCPKFDPAPWDGKVLEWGNKKFIKGKVFTLFFMPVNFGSVIVKLMAKVKDAGAGTPENLCLSDHTSKWNMDLYLAVDKEIPGAENVALSGRFFSKVYEGDFKETGKWCRDFENIAKERGMKIEKWYMWYTTCPKCAKKYGKNYTVIIGKIN
ncbi:MAG: hydrolase [Minisyncoccales bacterium]